MTSLSTYPPSPPLLSNFQAFIASAPWKRQEKWHKKRNRNSGSTVDFMYVLDGVWSCSCAQKLYCLMVKAACVLHGILSLSWMPFPLLFLAARNNALCWLPLSLAFASKHYNEFIVEIKRVEGKCKLDIDRDNLKNIFQPVYQYWEYREV